jgi:hypothetical protein
MRAEEGKKRVNRSEKWQKTTIFAPVCAPFPPYRSGGQWDGGNASTPVEKAHGYPDALGMHDGVLQPHFPFSLFNGPFRRLCSPPHNEC